MYVKELYFLTCAQCELWIYIWFIRQCVGNSNRHRAAALIEHWNRRTKDCNCGRQHQHDGNLCVAKRADASTRVDGSRDVTACVLVHIGVLAFVSHNLLRVRLNYNHDL
jgi:hypothetical protein